jgi:Spy/CpxP family protein refolding chaperone
VQRPAQPNFPCGETSFAARSLKLKDAKMQGESMPKKRLVILLIVVGAMALATAPLFAQASQSATGDANAQNQIASDQDIQLLRQNLREQRKQIMAANMVLTPDEATKFWPIFDQYRQEAIKPNDERWALIKDYAANYNTMTDAQAQDYIKRSTAVEQQLLALRMKYVPIFEKVISPKKTALWYQIDHRVDLMINLQLASIIPMVNANK